MLSPARCLHDLLSFILCILKSVITTEIKYKQVIIVSGKGWDSAYIGKAQPGQLC